MSLRPPGLRVLSSLLAVTLVHTLAGCEGDDLGDGGGGAGGAPIEVEPPPEVEGISVLEDENDDPRVVEVTLVAAPHRLQIAEGPETDVLAYNEQIPGPLLHARVGDRVIVHFTNELAEATTIHWHGLRISDQMDGSPMIQDPVQPGETFTYDFVVPDAGTYWYHTHLHQIEQLERGLYGAIVVHEAEEPTFSRERIFVGDDVRLSGTNVIAPFETSGPDIGMGRVGNTLLLNGREIPSEVTIEKGAIERWRFVSASNSLPYGLRIVGADVKVIATDGGLLPEPFDLERVEIAPGQRYDFEVRPHADAPEVRLEAMILVVNQLTGAVEEAPFELVVATVEGEIEAEEPVYPEITLPAVDVEPTRELEWVLAGGVVDNEVQFTINGEPVFVGDDHEHVIIETFEPNQPIAITLTSEVSPAHPFHVHGQFFQIIERQGEPVFEPGLRDTVHVRGQDSVKILGYFENPGRWMVHCHISEHAEMGMMADIIVGEASSHSH